MFRRYALSLSERELFWWRLKCRVGLPMLLVGWLAVLATAPAAQQLGLLPMLISAGWLFASIGLLVWADYRQQQS